MITRNRLIEYCLTYAGAYEDYPFDDRWAVMRHSGNRKGFAFIFERNGIWYVNLKCEPMQADFLRSVYKDVTPGFHMNKRHWNTVRLDGDVPAEDIRRMVSHSYGLAKPKMRRNTL